VLLAIGLVVGWATTVRATDVGELIERLEDGIDFRVRVQAALELGKTKDARARPPLEEALDDDNAAVRAASAAALKVLGDRRAIAALERHRKDSSPAVRSQIESSIQSLLAAHSAETKQKAEVLVQIGKFRNGSTTQSKSVVDDAERASRKKLEDLPGVEIVDDEPAPAARRNGKAPLPLVMVSGRVKKLESYREGSAVIYAASVEFVVHKMPGQTIKSVVSGSARASGSASSISDRRAMADLRRTALEAAIESAVSRAPQALKAAVE
jgi:hypothetical protein